MARMVGLTWARTRPDESIFAWPKPSLLGRGNNNALPSRLQPSLNTTPRHLSHHCVPLFYLSPFTTVVDRHQRRQWTSHGSTSPDLVWATPPKLKRPRQASPLPELVLPDY
ncbi:uncharacterized protein J3R85_011091 [Psidium guajava]|nr:uncharacterized protein J3R85_011091 [Psidium guajava]